MADSEEKPTERRSSLTPFAQKCLGTSSEEFKRKEQERKALLENLDGISHEFPEFTRSQMNEFKRNFMELDLDGSGDLDLFEVTKMMEKLGQTKTRYELREMIREVDMDGTGTINFREFLTVMVAPYRPQGPEAKPLSLFGRIYQSALADKAKYFEEQMRSARGKTDEEVQAEIKAEAAKRKLERQRVKEEKEEKERQEKEAKEREERRKRFAERAAKFGN